MEHVSVENRGPVRAILMRRAKANALNAVMIGELRSAIGEALADSSVRGVALGSACPRFFSSGFDAGEVFAFDRAAMRDFFARFTDLYESIALSPKPVVAAISGFAVAGGAVLAVACDFRVMADGPWGFALNEVNLGTLLPDGIIRLVLGAVAPGEARRILLAGETVSPARALETGLARELTTPESALDRAIALADSLSAKAPAAYAQVKERLRACGGFEKSGPASLDTFLDSWFSEEAALRRAELQRALFPK